MTKNYKILKNFWKKYIIRDWQKRDLQKNEESLSDKKEKSLDKSEMEKKENVGINSETRQIGVLKGFDEQDCFKINYTKILYTKIQKWRLAKMVQFKKKYRNWVTKRNSVI